MNRPIAEASTGVVFALTACALWGFAFLAPLLLPGYPASVVAFGRYAVFGVVALAFAFQDRANLARLNGRDWGVALLLAILGNFAYYLLLAKAIQLAGGALPTVIVGALPITIAIAGNALERVESRTAWARLVPSMAAMLLGILLVNSAELVRLSGANDSQVEAFATGAILAAGAVAAWTCYAIINARWLRRCRSLSPQTWTNAQGLLTLPIAAAGLAGQMLTADPRHAGVTGLLGATPGRFLAVILVLGVLVSWAAGVCWNAASRRLAAPLLGQLLAFEIVAGLCYNYWYLGELPRPSIVLGVALLLGGLAWGMRGGKEDKQPQFAPT